MNIEKLFLMAALFCVCHLSSNASKPEQPDKIFRMDNRSILEPEDHRHPVAKRNPLATADLVDLTDYYTASIGDDWPGKPGVNLSSMPQGLQIFAGNVFDVRGKIQLTGKAEKVDSLPGEVKGIRINNSGNSLYFLQGTVGSVQEDKRIGEYVLHYVNGKTVTIPIIYQRNVSDWMYREGMQIPTEAMVAWIGGSEASRKSGDQIQLYKYAVNNPIPDVAIESLDFISDRTASAPFLLAISMDKNLLGKNKPFRSVKIENALLTRSSEAGPAQVDLSGYFNTSPDDDWTNNPGHDFQAAPRGLLTLGGVKFDVRGMIVLASSFSLVSTRILFPEVVNGIKVNRKGQKIQFLQGCEHGAKPETQIAKYTIHYANGQTRDVPLLFMKNTFDWWCKPDVPLPAEPNVEEVWRGWNPAARNASSMIHLVKYTWENPLPEVEISSIDFVSDLMTAVPFLFAITVE